MANSKGLDLEAEQRTYLEHSLPRSSICQWPSYFTGRSWEYRERQTGALFGRKLKARFTAIAASHIGAAFKLQVRPKFGSGSHSPLR